MAKPLAGWARALLDTARVGHLATASAAGEPHVIPVCYALANDALYVAIDAKPKSGRRLLRLRNIDANGRAALVVDHYDTDWTRLAWVLARGPARVITAGDANHAPSVVALRARYPQYRVMRLEDAEIIELRPSTWTTWRAASEFTDL